MNNLPQYIEIEIGSFCNRTCNWCQNSSSDRGRIKQYISNETWLKILSELQEYNFSGRFAFHNYNEPLADNSIFEKITQAKEYLQTANLALYTNGDYLNISVLNQLISSGLSELRITLYPNNIENLQPSLELIEKFCKKLQLPYRDDHIVKKTKRFEARFLIDNLFVRIISPNIWTFNDRVGEITFTPLDSTKTRNISCNRPIHSASIDYLGNLKLCCQIYDTSDVKNKNYIIGNLSEKSFADLWFSPKFQKIKKEVLSANYKNLPVCNACSAKTTGDIEDNKRFNIEMIEKYRIKRV